NVHNVPADETAPLVVGARTDGTLGLAGQRDLYTFTLAADTKVVFDALTNNSAFNWSLIGPRGTLVSARNFTGSDSSAGDSVLDLAAGTYTLTVGASSDPAASFTQFASSVQSLSSQFSTTSWSAAQTLGAPNTFAYGDISTAWAPSTQNSGNEFVSVEFATPVFASKVTIRETWGNGFVTQVDLVDTNNVLHTVFSGVDPSQPGTPVDFSVEFAQTDYLVIGVKVSINTARNLSTCQ